MFKDAAARNECICSAEKLMNQGQVYFECESALCADIVFKKRLKLIKLATITNCLNKINDQPFTKLEGRDITSKSAPF